MREIACAVLAVLCASALCKSVAVKDAISDAENALKVMEDIKKCYKAAKDLQDDPSDGKKTSEFLDACETFLKEIKVTDIQKAALEKIGYKVDDLVGGRGFNSESNSKENVELSKKTRISKKKAHMDTELEDENLKTNEENESDVEVDRSFADQKKNSGEVKEQAITSKNQKTLSIDILKEREPQTEQHVSPSLGVIGQPPSVSTQTFPHGQPIHNQHAVAAENTFNLHITDYKQDYQQPVQFQPAAAQVNPAGFASPNFQNVLPEGGVQTQFHGYPEPQWNQQGAIPQQQIYPNLEYFNQPAEVLNDAILRARQEIELQQQANIPMNSAHGNAFMANPMNHHDGINPHMTGINEQGAANIFPQVDVPVDGQPVWSAGPPYGHVDQQYMQNFYPTNEAQNPNEAQPDYYFTNNYQRRVEL